MSLLRKNRKGVGRLLKQIYTLSFVFAVLFFGGSAVHSSAQLPKVPALEPKTEPAAPLDPLGRQTPRSSVIGFLKYEAIGDYATATHFLQLPPGENLAQLAKEMRGLYPDFQGSVNLLSDDPDGRVEEGLPPGQVRVGTVTVGGTTANIIAGAGGRPCCRQNLADFARVAGEYPEALRPVGERKAHGSSSNQARPA